jgi:release factor glutamine methyltransferase
VLFTNSGALRFKRRLVSPLCDSFARSIRGPIDAVIFNPPYVETGVDELRAVQSERGIAASWAGGEDGAAVIWEFLRFVANRERWAPDFFGVLLISAVNRPTRLKKFCNLNGLRFELVLERNCRGRV